MRSILPILFILILAMCSAPGASSSPGALDPSFGSAGWVATDLGGAGAIAMAVGSGITVLAEGSKLTLLRYRLDGSLDTTLTGDGMVEVPFRGYVAAMAVDSDETATVMADARKGPRLERFLSDGTIDQTFGDAGGKALGGHLFLRSMALQRDRKLLLVGESSIRSGRDVVLLRLRGSGTLDSSFGEGGLVRIDFGTPNDFGWQVATLPTGKIMVLASRNNCDSEGDCRVKGVLIRLNPDGSEDVSYGTKGQVRWRFQDLDPIDLAFGPRGQVVVLMAQYGSYGCPSGFANGLVEFRQDGAVAGRFGTDGRMGPLPIDPTDLAVQADGRIILSGHYCAMGGSQMDFGVVRILPSGRMDVSFGDGGLSAPRLGTFEARAIAVGLQADGKIVLAGGIPLVVVARYLTS